MGDVASSLFAMGYHEKVDGLSSDTPPFIIDLRKACFARIYTLDKNLAVFLGRPPRIVKEYCHFTLPSTSVHSWGRSHFGSTERLIPSLPQWWNTQAADNSGLEPFNYTADTRCGAMFAFLKEEVLQLLRKRHAAENTNAIRFVFPFLCLTLFQGLYQYPFCSKLRGRVEKQWADLPAHFRLSSSLKDCRLNPFERDFLAGTRLDYLHIHFLLGLAAQQKSFEPNEYLLGVAVEMLSITVEAIILRDELVNSGSCLIWKVDEIPSIYQICR